MPPTRATRRQPETAGRILAAAEESFAAHGMAGARTERIAARAGERGTRTLVAPVLPFGGAGLRVVCHVTTSSALGRRVVSNARRSTAVLHGYIRAPRDA